MVTSNKPEKIIVHHTADGSLDYQFAKVNVYHQQRFELISSLGYYCGYHYFVERDGRVIQARQDTDEGAHAKGQNFSSIGICLAGNFDWQSPTARQRNSLVALCADLCKKWGIKDSEIYPHRTFAIKSCYGQTLPEEWARDTFADFRKDNLKNITWELRAILEKLQQKYEHQKES